MDQKDEIEITPQMIEAAVSALYAELGFQLEGNVEDGVRAALSAALSFEAHPEDVGLQKKDG